MELVLQVLSDALQENLAWVTLTIICVAMLYLINTALGFAMAYFKCEVDMKFLLATTIRNMVVLICLFATCYALNVFMGTLNVISGLSINTDVVSTMEIIAIVLAWCVDLSKNILEKLKSFKELKYIKYEDIVLDDGIGELEDKG